MPAVIEDIVQSTLMGKNAVVNAAPGVGAAGKVLYTLETMGLEIGYLNLAESAAGIYFGSSSYIGREIWLKKAVDFAKAEVLVLDRASQLSGSALEIIKKLMSDRIIYETYLAKVKSVVLIFTDGPQTSFKKLSDLPNTALVSIN